MSEFRQKLKYLLDPKNSNERIFNNLFSKLHKRIKSENIAKLIHITIDRDSKSPYSKHNHINTTSKSKKKVSFIDKKIISTNTFQNIKKSKSTRNLLNIMRTLSINDIHENENDIEKEYNFINRFKSANHIKMKKYNLNKNLKYIDKIMNNNPYRNFINNLKTKKNKNKMDSSIYNTFFSYRENINPNNNLNINLKGNNYSTIRINKKLLNQNKKNKNVFRTNNNIYTTNITKSNFNRYNLLDNNKIKNNKLLKISLI